LPVFPGTLHCRRDGRGHDLVGCVGREAVAQSPGELAATRLGPRSAR
jgi:hypothetical protein